MTVIFRCQSVSVYWKSIIDQSSPLQQALYFKPLPAHKRRGTDVFSPLLKEVFIEWFPWSYHYSFWGDKNRESVAYIPMKRNDPEVFRRPEIKLNGRPRPFIQVSGGFAGHMSGKRGAQFLTWDKLTTFKCLLDKLLLLCFSFNFEVKIFWKFFIIKYSFAL